ncbi:uncharacterized protein PHACADRAFT_260143 [Phanerochaete carnosa HHB-10118-sp]|uniref:Protein kinase domain-containing protein n=1 Tax=Phanerochaete carnosa (strain HHB-10118-sp) TaxID=650164 RepID=K5UUH8_PHACS|nr:uncharacterized protein PHACADRAFT_260143 [Phanerochaete carnosa HHB-10118-sp]EKM53666.1 hypothetical protein PHACADRAFT_260143 [Phanerochaete carnosa HHB-10118-sp]
MGTSASPGHGADAPQRVPRIQAYCASPRVYLVPVFYESGTLDLCGSEPPRTVNSLVIYLEYIRDSISLAAIDSPRPPMCSIISSNNLLTSHGVIHADTNQVNFLLVPAHKPSHVVLVDFADS